MQLNGKKNPPNRWEELLQAGAEGAELTEIYRALPRSGRARLLGFARGLAADFSLEDLEDKSLCLVIHDNSQVTDLDSHLGEGRTLELEKIKRIAT